jgi:hypothetical protein
MHLMLVDMVVVILGEDTVAEVVVLVEVEVAPVMMETKIKLSDYQWCQHFRPQLQFQP